jgi:actin-related protein
MAAYSPNDVVQAVVADLGQGQTKMGWAGEDYPKSYFRSVSEISSYRAHAPALPYIIIKAKSTHLSSFLECGSVEKTRK